jgi:hypothetical protein
MTSDGLYMRGVALCAIKWGYPPHVIRQMTEAGKIAIEDVIELLIITGHSDSLTSWVSAYLFPKEPEFVSEEDLRTRQEIDVLAAQLLAEPDHEKKALIKVNIDRLSQELQQ